MNRNKAVPPFLLVLFLCFFQKSYSQTLLSTLDTYNNSYPAEKVYVHFDKQAYSLGETIWFKAYLMTQGFPAAISTNFYTELLDGNGKVVSQAVFPISEATAAGSITLPSTAKNGTLFFRAYTKWMLNFDTAFLYVKPVTLINEIAQTPKSAPQLRFFPEGGDLIADFESVLAFKATNNEQPIAVSGVIKDAGGKVITSFKSMHDGMGKVAIEPVANTAYYAEWKDDKGILHKSPLPVAKSSGHLLQVKQSGNYIAYVIKRSDIVTPAQQRVHLVAQMQQQMVYRAAINLSQTNIISGTIKTDSLTTGTLQLTLFDNEWNPLAERIVFVNKNDYAFRANINPYSKNLAKRAKNIVEIEVPDTMRSNLSISITDGQLESNAEDNIVSHFLLTTDLRGAIYQPAYYFSNNSDSVKEHLDLVMLTNGWRRYDWTALKAGQLPVIKYPKENYLSIKGMIYGASAAELAASPQLNLILQTKDSATRFLFASVDKAGNFSTEPLVFFDTVSVFYQFNQSNRLNKTASVDFTQAFLSNPHIGLDSILIAQQASFQPVLSRARFLDQKREEIAPLLNKRMRTLAEVVVNSKVRSREQELEKKYVSGLFQSGNSRSFNLLDDPFATASLNIFTYLEGKVAGLQITGSGFDYTATRRGSTPAFFIDEMQVETEYVSTIPMSNVAYIKVIDPPFIGAAGNGAGGAISIYTKKGGDQAKNTTSKGLSKGQIVGYAPVKQFYSPDYAHSSPTDDIEDVRSTLYWNPYILTDKTMRRVKVEFYNNDISTSYRVVLEGINEEGKLTRIEKLIQ